MIQDLGVEVGEGAYMKVPQCEVAEGKEGEEGGDTCNHQQSIGGLEIKGGEGEVAEIYSHQIHQ